VVGLLPEVEAWKLAIVFEEVGAYRYRSNKDMESQNRMANTRGPGWEESFEFGSADENDYGDRPDITRGEPIEE